ncbi:MAG TPA: histidinol dehydrogenase [Rhodanobacteraceae bacterium]|nr:histidinol dehydrogenase [Rhodanobacteraceae bacterium]
MTLLDWPSMSATEQREALRRPAQAHDRERAAKVAAIMRAVRMRGDAALRELTEQFDGCRVSSLAVDDEAFETAERMLPSALKQAIAEASARIEQFHHAAMQGPIRVETAPGVICERLPRAIARVGLYVPAGSAPLPSTVLMLGVPARLAGCREVVLCSPPQADGSVDPAVLYAARQCGINRVFRLGGAQAVAAMTWGSESVPACDKLFGPGNAWVTEAKRQAAAEPGGPAIDMPAGPSEVLVIADAGADPRFVAADLLSQAEHGPDSQVILLTDTPGMADAVADEVEAQLRSLPRADIARRALASSRLIKVDSIAQAAEVSNAYAPEHLILHVRDPRALLNGIDHAGSVFLGAWSPESVGDYCSGTNHVLPTYGHARALSGLSVDSFRKYVTVQELSAEGLRAIGPCAVTLARAEGLDAHARAVSLRLETLECDA